MIDNSYHFIGIGGIGMSGLARILLQRGCKVSGSDLNNSILLEILKKEGASVYIGHQASHVPVQGKVVCSSDIALTNVEYKEAQKKGLTLIHRSTLLQELMEGYFSLLVTGTHGKTTTSSLLAHTLVFSGEKASYSIGGIVQSLQSNGASGEGKWFVAEADESDGSFLAYKPYGAIVTNIDLDHLNFWKTEENLLQGFLKFYQKVEQKEFLFWCADDERLASLDLEGVSYGFSNVADLKIEEAFYLGWKSSFTLSWKGKRYEGIEIPLIGAHNVLNATAVFGLCIQIGLEETQIRQAFSQFLGVKRRAEKKGEASGVAIYDDYAHHPVEIGATLTALHKASQGRRVVVLFQPHRFTRTKDCFEEFAPALQNADFIVLTDVYGAGEEPIDQINSENLFKTLVKLNSSNSCYIPKENLLEEVLQLIKPEDVVVTMGAGDITQLGPKLLAKLGSLE